MNRYGDARRHRPQVVDRLGELEPRCGRRHAEDLNVHRGHGERVARMEEPIPDQKANVGYDWNVGVDLCVVTAKHAHLDAYVQCVALMHGGGVDPGVGDLSSRRLISEDASSGIAC